MVFLSLIRKNNEAIIRDDCTMCQLWFREGHLGVDRRSEEYVNSAVFHPLPPQPVQSWRFKNNLGTTRWAFRSIFLLQPPTSSDGYFEAIFYQAIRVGYKEVITENFFVSPFLSE